jgi:hypothetical protein
LGRSEGGDAEDQQPDATERLSMAPENGRSTGEEEMEKLSPELMASTSKTTAVRETPKNHGNAMGSPIDTSISSTVS